SSIIRLFTFNFSSSVLCSKNSQFPTLFNNQIPKQTKTRSWQKNKVPVPALTAHSSFIYCHSHHGINSACIQRLNFLHRADPAGHNQPPFRRISQSASDLQRKPAHGAFSINVSIEKGAAIW